MVGVISEIQYKNYSLKVIRYERDTKNTQIQNTKGKGSRAMMIQA